MATRTGFLPGRLGAVNPRPLTHSSLLLPGRACRMGLRYFAQTQYSAMPFPAMTFIPNALPIRPTSDPILPRPSGVLSN
jgi:hypothetical protein